MASTTGVSLRVLGRASIKSQESASLDLATTRARALLFYLSVEKALGTEAHSREQLTELLWPGMPPASGRKNLRQTLYYLRQAIPNHSTDGGSEIPLLLADRREVALHPKYPLRLDLAEFLRLLHGPADGWDEALTLYQGDFLADFSLADANPFEAWSAARRAAFRNQALRAIDQLVRDSLGHEQFETAERLARRGLVLDPLRESTWRGLMKALVLAGRRGEALAEYEACAETLMAEIGVEPSEETMSLYRRILEGIPLQIESSRSRHLRPGKVRPGHNLPAQTTSFVGRHEDLRDISDLLLREDVRLITLSGPGGIGKTRLSIEVATGAMPEFPDGVYFSELAPIADPAQILPTIAASLGLKETGDTPLVESFTGFLRDKKILLVVDNFEHLVEGAPLVSDLLAASPKSKVIASSRELLRVYGEYEYPVSPLPLPDPEKEMTLDTISQVDSVSLFVQRAKAVRQAFELTESNAPVIAEICTRLDGLPLAIELAAARIRLFSPEVLLDRLADRFQVLTGGARDAHRRQQTLRNTIEWSYNLLTPSEKQLFARLSVFQGGRSLEAVEAVCGPGLATDTLASLESLLDKSLLRRVDGPKGQPRFVMLETIHEFACEKLADFGEEDDVRLRHAEFFVSLAQQVRDKYDGPDQPYWSESFMAELDNIRTALTWSLDHGKIEIAALLVGHIGIAVQYEAHHAEGRRWIDRILPHLDSLPEQTLLQFIIGVGHLVFNAGYGIEQIMDWLTRGVELARELDDPIAEAWALLNLGLMAIAQPENKDQFSRPTYDALEIFREHNHVHGEIKSLNQLGEVARVSGDFQGALAAYEAALELANQTGRRFRATIVEVNLANLAHVRGDYEKALHYHRKVFEGFYEAGNLYGIMHMSFMAGTLTAMGQPKLAARLIGAGDAMREYYGTKPDVGDREIFEQMIVDTRHALGEAEYEKYYQEGRKLSLTQAAELALAYEP